MIYRFKNLLEREITSRNQAEVKESEYHRKLDIIMQELNQKMQENRELSLDLQSIKSSFEREKMLLISTYDAQVNALTNDRDRILKQSQMELDKQCKHLKESFEHQQGDYEAILRNNVKTGEMLNSLCYLSCIEEVYD